MRIFVTGANSHLARVLLPQLCSLDSVTQITGLDIHPVCFTDPKFEFHLCDIRDTHIRELMQNHDILIHLAFVVLRNKQLGRQRKQRELVRDINLRGSQNVFQAAAANHYRQIIHLSSASVYGAKPGNPLYMDEHQPLTPMTGFSYAEDKVALEHWLADFGEQHHDIAISVFRPHVILGQHAQPFLIEILNQPFYPRLPEPAPLVQCVWEDDVARAVCAACDGHTRGIFNLAADPAMSFRDMLAITRRVHLGLPVNLLIVLHRLLWRFTGRLEEPGWLAGMRYSLTINCDQARRVLGWESTLSTRQILEKYIN